MKITQCFKKLMGLDDYEEIHQSEGHPWNCWLVTESGFSTFRTGLFWDYLEHLANCTICRREVGVDLETVEKLLDEIKKEWEKVTK